MRQRWLHALLSMLIMSCVLYQSKGRNKQVQGMHFHTKPLQFDKKVWRGQCSSFQEQLLYIRKGCGCLSCRLPRKRKGRNSMRDKTRWWSLNSKQGVVADGHKTRTLSCLCCYSCWRLSSLFFLPKGSPSISFTLTAWFYDAILYDRVVRFLLWSLFPCSLSATFLSFGDTRWRRKTFMSSLSFTWHLLHVFPFLDSCSSKLLGERQA